MKNKVVLIEDNATTQQMLTEIFTEEGYEVVLYNSPHEYIMAGKPKAGVLISDWNFGHVTLEYYLKEFKDAELVIYSGSIIVMQVDCVAVLGKFETEKLVCLVKERLKPTRPF